MVCTETHSTQASEDSQGRDPTDTTLASDAEDSEGEYQDHDCLPYHHHELSYHLSKEDLRPSQTCEKKGVQHAL